MFASPNRICPDSRATASLPLWICMPRCSFATQRIPREQLHLTSVYPNVIEAGTGGDVGCSTSRVANCRPEISHCLSEHGVWQAGVFVGAGADAHEPVALQNGTHPGGQCTVVAVDGEPDERPHHRRPPSR